MTTPPRTTATLRSLLPIGLAIMLVALGCSSDWPDPAPLTLAQHKAEVAEWREDRRRGLVTPPSGPVLWIGLWELSPGETPFGSDPSLPVVLPAEDAPPRVGTLVREEAEVGLRPESDALELVDGSAVTGPMVLATDRSEEPTELRLGSLGIRIHEERGTDRRWLRVWDTDHPDAQSFELPEMYEVDPRWRVAARFDAFPEPREMRVADVTGGTVTNRVPGELVFRLDGREHRLLASADTNSTSYFVMVWDSTALSTTYEAGRYVRAPLADSTGWTVLDFNRTYNPPCVFTPYSVCAFPPPENRLDLAITAGEKRAERVSPSASRAASAEAPGGR